MRNLRKLGLNVITLITMMHAIEMMFGTYRQRRLRNRFFKHK